MKCSLSILHICVCIAALLCSESHGGETLWQHDANEPGDWFDPANWTAGVPTQDDSARIQNDGATEIWGGEAMAGMIQIGTYWAQPDSAGGGAVRQIGGVLSVAGSISLSGGFASHGIYELIGGRLSARTIQIGNPSGNAEFKQTGGVNTVEADLSVGSQLLPTWSMDLIGPIFLPSGLGTYELIGGELSTGQTSVGTFGHGEFRQTGGVHTVEETLSVDGRSGWFRFLTSSYIRPLVVGDDGQMIPEVGPVAFLLTPPESRYELSGGTLSTRRTAVGVQGRGTFIQTGGTHNAEHSLRLGDEAGSHGTYIMESGILSADTIGVGHGRGDGLFRQTGGICSVGWELKVGDWGRSRWGYSSVWITPLDEPLGTYELAGGILSTHRTSVGVEGRGRFVQTGGIHRVDVLRIGGPRVPGPIPVDLPDVITFPSSLINRYQLISTDALGTAPSLSVIIPPPAPSEGRYELSGGRLAARQEEIRHTGVMSQTGGYHRVGYLAVRSGGRYELTGGRVRIGAGLDLEGELDFEGSTAVLGGGGLINFSRGALLNAENATVHAGRRSLTIFAEDFDPRTQLGRFRSDGLVHFAGSDLLVPSGRGFRGWGRIDDHVETHGPITAAPDGWIDLHEGLFVHGSSVDLGSGELRVMNRRSGMNGGELAVDSLTIGREIMGIVLQDGTVVDYPPGLFRQIAGTNAIADKLDIYRGSYELHDGALSTYHLRVGKSWSGLADAEFVQMGGILDVHSLHLGGTYGQFVVLRADPLAIQGATASEIPGFVYLPDDFPVRIPSPVPTYRLSGGELSAGSVHVGGRLIQTGGSVHVRDDLSIGGDYGNYVMLDGSLTTSKLKIGRGHSEGTLAILNADCEINVSSRLTFAWEASFLAVPGSIIRMTEPSPPYPYGARVSILGSDPAAVGGLGNLTLLFESGDEFVATLEVAGEDRGVGYAGFFENFALDTLQVGTEEEVASVQLVDLIDNQPEWEGAEVLYVKEIIIGPGSHLDLNGLNIYYLSSDISPGTLISGGSMIAIPEPTTVGLLTLGAIWIARRRRGR